ncbi:MAG: hypothetical protein WCD76_01995, partial [Pyrinomonadaceae bacterium]
MFTENSIVSDDLHRESRQVGIARLYCDARIVGQPKYVFTDKPESLMYVPSEVRRAVVFLGYQTQDGVHRLAGTAFFVARFVGNDKPQFVGTHGKGFTYLITAKHVIDGIRDKNIDKVWVRINFHVGQARWLETNINDWLFHPTEPNSVDVALLRASVPDEFDHLSLPAGSSATDE